MAGGIALAICAQSATLDSHHAAPGSAPPPDPVVERIYEHFGDSPRPLVIVVDSSLFPARVWNRVKNLVAFRMHRHQPDGTTRTDAATYLVRDSDVYLKAAAALRNQTTNHEYVWCLLVGVLAHEAAHTAPMTEQQALTAEAAQLRRCLFAGHLYSGDGWSPGSYLQTIEAKLRRPREHY
jgi:hypothetical protein